MFPPVPAGDRRTDRHLGSSTSFCGEGAMLSSAQTVHGAALAPGPLLLTTDRRGWLPNATTGCGDILPLSQTGFRQLLEQHLRISLGDKQQHCWRGAGHVRGRGVRHQLSHRATTISHSGQWL